MRSFRFSLSESTLTEEVCVDCETHATLSVKIQINDGGLDTLKMCWLSRTALIGS